MVPYHIKNILLLQRPLLLCYPPDHPTLLSHSKRKPSHWVLGSLCALSSVVSLERHAQTPWSKAGCLVLTYDTCSHSLPELLSHFY